MSLLAPRHRYTFEEYLELEEIARIRHEFYAGEIYAMARGTPEHAAMAAAITSMLSRQLGSAPCRVYSSDLRVRVLATGLATYDRGEKLLHYRQIPSLEAAVLVDHERIQIELWTRSDGAWIRRDFGAGEVVPLEGIACTLAVDAVYAAARDA